MTLGSAQYSESLWSGYRLLTCTTPIAYIKLLPVDPFSYVQGRRCGRAAGPNLPPDGSILTTEKMPGFFWRNLTEMLRNGVVVRDPSYAGGNQQYWIDKAGIYPVWLMFSFGPDYDYRGGSTGYYEPTYDPSNGLRSDGDIYFLGPGIGFVNKGEGPP